MGGFGVLAARGSGFEGLRLSGQGELGALNPTPYTLNRKPSTIVGGLGLGGPLGI